MEQTPHPVLTGPPLPTFALLLIVSVVVAAFIWTLIPSKNEDL